MKLQNFFESAVGQPPQDAATLLIESLIRIEGKVGYDVSLLKDVDGVSLVEAVGLLIDSPDELAGIHSIGLDLYTPIAWMKSSFGGAVVFTIEPSQEPQTVRYLCQVDKELLVRFAEAVAGKVSS